MAEEEIKKNKSQRKYLYGQLTYYKNRLNEIGDGTIGEFKSILSKLKEHNYKFEKVQSSLEYLGEDDDDATAARDRFDDTYHQIEAQVLNAIHVLESTPNVTQRSENKVITSPPLIKLPEIDLPKFDGLEMNWLSFKARFNDMLHNNEKLTETVKFHHLVSCVAGGKAYPFIKNIPISGDNYAKAWKVLLDLYDNEITIQKIHIKNLFDIKRPQEGSFVSLQKFIDDITQHKSALDSFESISTDNWDLLLIHHFSEKLDTKSRVEVIEKSPTNKHLNLEQFLTMLRKRAMMLKSIAVSSDKASTTVKPFKKEFIQKKVHASNLSSSCHYCKGDHVLIKCPKFTDPKVEPQKRYEFVKRMQLCTNCFSDEHRVAVCTNSPCKFCSSKHNLLLHFGSKDSSEKLSKKSLKCSSHSNSLTANSNGDMSNFSTNDIQVESQTSSPLLVGSNNVSNDNNHGQILLATAVIVIRSPSGDSINCRALLDSGSQSNFITEKICRFMRLPKRQVSIPVSGITQNSFTVRHEVDLQVESRTTDYKVNMTCLVLPQITGKLPNASIDFNPQMLHSSIELADPWFFKPDDIDMLIGAEFYFDIVNGETSVLVNGLPPFQNTVFGQILGCKITYSHALQYSINSSVPSVSNCCTLDDLNAQVQRFWQLNQISNPNSLSIEEKLCEKHYSESVTRDNTGRYSVALPIKSNIDGLGDSDKTALNQFKNMERKLSKNSIMREPYVAFMKEYLEMGHMELVENPNVIENEHGKQYFLPHHAVIRENSSTTKVRVVFNASAKSSSNVSLNDCLMVGPTIQQDLFSIVARFRKFKIGFTGDIAKMYRQVEIQSDQRDLLRIWWRDSPEKDLQCFRMCTVTYGTASAPFQAIRTLKQLADDEANNHPESSKILARDFYVDDVLTGADSETAAERLKNDLTELLRKGGFELRKFESNSSRISSTLEIDDDHEKPISILGIRWNTKSDNFEIQLNKYDLSSPCTKRSVLSEIAQLFDPLGLIAPMVFIAKVFMQSIWAKSNLSWDSELPDDMTDYWISFKSQVVELRYVTVPRCISPINKIKLIELHGFADASELGYGCAIYIRVVNDVYDIAVNLLCAKSRVAPLKKQTIPRLELCAALLLSQLMDKIITVMEINVDSIYYWSDSEITLFRIKSIPSKYATFVANRISHIQELSSSNLWYFVSTDENPADIVSRGLMPIDLQHSNMWFNGPQFLYLTKDNWPRNPKNSINNDLLELRKNETLLVTNIQHWEVLDRFSSYSKLLKVIAWCKRFISNCRVRKENRNFSAISASEMELSLKSIILNIQSVEFADDISHLHKFKFVAAKSKILKLSPFLDEKGVLRVGGRLHNANISYDNQHQMLLPTHHSFSKMLIRHLHFCNLHAGAQSLMYNLRLRFWIIGAKSLCKRVIHECILCFRYRAQTMKQIMGQLPAHRVNPTRPFEVVGVDFCGPFNITHKLRSVISTKVYIAVYICFVTKAIHMEIVSDLSVEAFLSSLRRFVARRGLCSHIYSDNATNFVGAKKELTELHRLFTSEVSQHTVQRFCIEKGMEWHTIPPRSPHFGGLWEAAVKSAKYHLKRVLSNHTFTREDLETLVIQTEAILNSRPLSPMSDDPSDLNCLTPGHFINGSPLTSLPDPDLSHLNFNKLSNYQKIQALLRDFWRRWSLEYLSGLQEKSKWCIPNENVQIGSLVLLKEDNTPPMKWNLGRVTEIYYGKDNFVRVVTVKTATSVFKRAITKICLLPIQDG